MTTEIAPSGLRKRTEYYTTYQQLPDHGATPDIPYRPMLVKSVKESNGEGAFVARTNYYYCPADDSVGLWGWSPQRSIVVSVAPLIARTTSVSLRDLSPEGPIP